MPRRLLEQLDEQLMLSAWRRRSTRRGGDGLRRAPAFGSETSQGALMMPYAIGFHFMGLGDLGWAECRPSGGSGGGGRWAAVDGKGMPGGRRRAVCEPCGSKGRCRVIAQTLCAARVGPVRACVRARARGVCLRQLLRLWSSTPSSVRLDWPTHTHTLGPSVMRPSPHPVHTTSQLAHKHPHACTCTQPAGSLSPHTRIRPHPAAHTQILTFSLCSLTQILAYVSKVRDIGCSVDNGAFTMADVESNIVRCPDQAAAHKMIDGGCRLGGGRARGNAGGAREREWMWLVDASTSLPPTTTPLPTPSAINEVRTRGESCGGEVTCVVRRCPKGLGSPVFDKLEAELGKAMMSLPATKVGWLRGCKYQPKLNQNQRKRAEHRQRC